MEWTFLLISRVDTAACILQGVNRDSSSHTFPPTSVVRFLDDGCPDGGEVAPGGGFNLCSSSD